MIRRPATVEVFDPIHRALHGLALVGALGVLATGPLVEQPSAMAAAPALHGGFAACLAVAWGFHLLRVCLAWLEGTNPWALVPRPSDGGEALSWLGGCLGGRKTPDRDRYSFRERWPYGFWMLTLPVLGVTGWAVGHPGWAVRWVGPDTLLSVARGHGALGALWVPVVGWHLYFAVLAPEKLWWNGAWVTGRIRWERAARAWPAWTRRIEAELNPVADGEVEAPSVEDLLEQGNRAARGGEPVGAEEAYREALALYPGYSQALFNLGVLLWKEGRKEEARESLERFLDQDPFGPAASRARDLLALEGESDHG